MSKSKSSIINSSPVILKRIVTGILEDPVLKGYNAAKQDILLQSPHKAIINEDGEVIQILDDRARELLKNIDDQIRLRKLQLKKDIIQFWRGNKKLTFDEWYSENEEEINIELAESGADRELDFDSEQEFENRYELYLLS